MLLYLAAGMQMPGSTMQDDLSPISRMMNGGGGVDEVSGPVENTGVLMSQPPGHITAPMRAWTRSRSLTFGFYEWPPFADSFRFFSKRSGVVMGTEVLMPASQLELPALAKSTDGDPQYAAARYIEFTMEGLKPNSRYTLKVGLPLGASPPPPYPSSPLPADMPWAPPR